MSRWHRDFPELEGTEADPAMEHESHRQAREELVRMGLVYGECPACGANDCTPATCPGEADWPR